MQKDIGFNFFSTKEKKPEIKRSDVLNLIMIVVVLTFTLTFTKFIFDKAGDEMIKEFVQYIDEKKTSESGNVRLRGAVDVYIKVNKEKDSTIVMTEDIFNNDRMKKIITQLKEKNYKILKIENIINVETGDENIQLTLKKE